MLSRFRLSVASSCPFGLISLLLFRSLWLESTVEVVIVVEVAVVVPSILITVLICVLLGMGFGAWIGLDLIGSTKKRNQQKKPTFMQNRNKTIKSHLQFDLGLLPSLELISSRELRQA